MNNEQKYIMNNLPCPICVGGLYTIHYFKYGKNFKFEGESHDFWEMVFIDSGSAKILADDKILSLNQGEAFFHKPNQKHNIYTEESFANSAIVSFKCKSRAIKLLSDKILKLDDFEKYLLNKIISEAKIGYTDKLNDLYLTKMSKSTNQPFGNDQTIKNCIELLIISLIRNQKSNKQSNEININLSTDKIVESVTTVLSEMLDQGRNINLEYLSRKLCFSKSYIKLQFKKKTGYSIIQYYINMKIEKAKKLLSQQKFTVSEISDVLGFSSVYYFSRQFKLRTDMSPTEYVLSIKADNLL